MGLGSGACFGQPYRVTPGPLCLSMYRSGRGVSVHFLQTAQTAPPVLGGHAVTPTAANWSFS
ncbi:hypothetical protein SSBG_01470 [Streptomyces sp. SPB074]|nr:hypothetical protein SSBG_01470 [Streptomyces sp. SPB074]